jgi:uncharacterized PurR-regulated membrane protein YhhQ (DUF165 family)
MIILACADNANEFFGGAAIRKGVWKGLSSFLIRY